MASILSYLNRILPFATPGTPVIQDILHLAAICGALYFAPQIQEWYQQRQHIQENVTNNQPRPQDEQPAPPNAVVGNNDTNPPAAAVEAVAVANHDDQDRDPEEADAQPRQDDINNDPGPAPDMHRIPDMPPARNVGAKKAKALAKKDQRRAYHEFQRSQGEAQRARDAEGAAEREAEVAAERERRGAAEAKVRAREESEREKKREGERKAREVEVRRRERVVEIVREEVRERGACELMKVARRVGEDVDEEWVEGIVKASGILGRKGEVVTMITGLGWVVRVTEQDMAEVYRRAIKEQANEGEDGAVSFETLGRLLQEVIVQR